MQEIREAMTSIREEAAQGRPPSPAAEFQRLREQTEALCAPLEIEDHVVQPAPFVSPPKWHLAHTTWFFEEAVLGRFLNNYRPVDECFNRLFNSYYKSAGEHWLQDNRGHLSRPTVAEVLDWRREVDRLAAELLERRALDERGLRLVEIGLQHEMQHQELLLMDIKAILAGHPWAPPYDAVSSAPDLPHPPPAGWLECGEGPAETGAGEEGFAYDNERPRHRTWLAAHRIADRLVSNGEYLAFVADGGYRRPELWLSDGWDWVQREGAAHPLYWRREDGWLEYQLGGLQPLREGLPVSHVSYYEADAYARWRGARLPTEFELEHFLRRHGGRPDAGRAGWAPGEAICPLPARACDRFGNGLLWQWTSSAYAPYPGFRPEEGALAEYNGKFMCNQYVLKGGCVATPRGHLRPSYRNFFRAHDRWPFTGIRLAENAA